MPILFDTGVGTVASIAVKTAILGGRVLLGLGASGISECVRGMVKDITYANIPELPNGIYDVYSMDVVTSRTTVINGATGQMEVIESHTVTTWFTLIPGISNETLQYAPASQKTYYSVVYVSP